MATFLHSGIYYTAFLRNDEASMQQQLTWTTGRSGEEDWLLSAQADTEAYRGRLTKSRDFSRRAMDSALRADAKETAALWQVNAALLEAEFGNASSARQNASAAQALVPAGRDIRDLGALSLARAGDSAQAQKLAEGLNKDFPLHTIVQGYWLPSIRAAVALKANDAAKALELLQPAVPYGLGQSQPFAVGMMYPVYLRGQAYLLARQGKEAVGEFRKIIEHTGIVLNFPIGALAHLGLARAYALQRDTANARAAYKDFFKLWQDADPEIPILREAKAKYVKLQLKRVTDGNHSRPGELVIQSPGKISSRVPLEGERDIVLAASPQMNSVFRTTTDAQHLVFELTCDRWSVRDLDSRNGTRVNGSSVSEPLRLVSGDQITAGRLSIRYTAEPAIEDTDYYRIEGSNVPLCGVCIETAEPNCWTAARKSQGRSDIVYGSRAGGR